MTEALTLKTSTPPSFINKDTAIGTLLGTFVWPGLGTLVGAVAGAAVGHARLKNEAANGKVVTDTPSFWNKDTLLGGSIGLALGGLATAVAVIGGVSLTMVGGGVVGIPLAVGGLLAGTAVSTAIGTYIGGRHGQKRHLGDYAQAVEQQIAEARSAMAGRSQSMQMGPYEDTGKKFAEQIASERGQAPASGKLR